MLTDARSPLNGAEIDEGRPVRRVQGLKGAFQRKLPLIIGVTGHRDADCGQANELCDAVKAVFRSIRSTLPNTPLLVVSALAEGADRLVARIALDHFQAELIAPLPFPRQIYEKDFSGPDSCKEFRALLERGTEIELPLVGDNTIPNIDDPDRRRAQYKAVGQYIVRHCHILVALWDGKAKAESGGTAQVVGLQLDGDPDSRPNPGRLDPPNRGPVYHVITPRLGRHSDLGGSAYTCKVQYPTALSRPIDASEPSDSEPDNQRVYDAILRRIDDFNWDVDNVLPAIDQMRRDGHPKAPKLWISDEDAAELPATSQSLLGHYGSADALAMHYADKTRRSFSSLFGLAFSAIVVFELWAHVLKPFTDHAVSPGAPAALLLGSLVLYPVLWLIAFVLWKRAERRDWQDKFQDYRALAEALRVQVAWNAVGITDSVDDSYLRKQRGELEWIRYGLRTWTWHASTYREPARKPTLRQESLARIRRVWIDSEVDWFSKEWRKQERRFKTYHKRGRLRFLISLIIAVLLVVAVVISGVTGSLMNKLFESGIVAVDKPELWDHMAIDLIVALIALFTVGAATAIAWLEKMAFAEHANQYRTMYNLFSYAATRFGDIENDDDACIEFFRELGQDALNENGDWLLMHRERRLELPIL